MKLMLFLKTKAVSQKNFAEQISERLSRINKYCLGTRIPRPEIMAKIYAATGGAVTPNDFYDLPDDSVFSPAEPVAVFAAAGSDAVAEGLSASPAVSNCSSFSEATEKERESK